MPSIRPSRFWSSSRTASVTAGLRKKEAMNLALPSGSSPPEKPPGSMTIWLFRMAFTRASQLAVTSAGVRLRMTRISGSAPARGKGMGGVVLAVGAGEDRDDDLGLGHADLGSGGGEPSGCRPASPRRSLLCGRGKRAPAWPPRSPAAGPYPAVSPQDSNT